MHIRQALIGFCVLAACTTIASAIPISIVDNLPGVFTDISGFGTLLSPPADGTVTTTSGGIGNLLFPIGNIVVGENGGLGFQNPPLNNVPPNNAMLPSNNLNGGGKSIAGYWDNISTCPGKMGGIFRAVSGSAVIIQYNRVCVANPFRGGNPDMLTFQIKIFDNPIPAPGIFAQIIFADIQGTGPNGGASATIGYQDGGFGNNDFQWSFDTANSVMDGTVLSIVPEPGSAAIMALGLAGACITAKSRRRLPR